MRRRQKVPKLVNLAILTTITIFVWIFFDVYRAIKKTPEVNVSEEILSPILPSLNDQALTEIQNDLYFEKSSFIPPTPTPVSIEEAPEEQEVINTEDAIASPSSELEI